MAKARQAKELLGKPKHIGEAAERYGVLSRYLSMGYWKPRHKLAPVGQESVKKNRLYP